MKTRVSALLLCVFLLLASAAPACAAGFDREVLDGVVYLREYVVLDGEFQGSWRGTAFFIGEEGKDPQYLVTNLHVIEHFLATGGGQGESRLYVVYDENDSEEAFLVDYSKDMDLAVLKLDQPTDKRVPLCLELPTQELVGSTVYAVGYPSVADVAVDALASYRTEDATVTTGSISRLLTESGTGRRVLQLDVSIQGGNSGGPLVTEDGTVVGINTFGVTVTNYDTSGAVTSEASVDYALNVEELIPLLDKNNVPYQIGRDGFPYLLVVAGAAAVVLLALAAVLVLRRRRAKPAAVRVKKSPHKPEPSPAPTPQPASTPNVSRSTPLLRSLSPQHGGAAAPVPGQPGILVGRDSAACQVLFPEGTPGVSARHCSVSWSEPTGEFLLTDLKSTYGTFLSGGQKLTPGVPCRLRPGDVFYLGDPENALRVELG
ncbi:hypothetical protein B5E80_04020 [Flavonifractor sp. An135]|nr:trypsin-like peptidase domain-containing protein [Flavonifractor sp. An135]OUQ25763.1 hypothetical protein B5E80_04020 [Flavonifractor sp. An135]